MDSTLIVKYSPTKSWVLVVVLLCLGIGGYFVTHTAKAPQEAQAVVWGVITGALLVVPATLRRLLLARPVLILTVDDLRYEPLALGPVPWSSISRVWVQSIVGFDGVCLSLKEPEKYFQNLSKWNRLTERTDRRRHGADVVIRCITLDHSAQEVAALIERRVAESQPAQG
ncbi:MAG: STM3941 family protein [bacterium]